MPQVIRYAQMGCAGFVVHARWMLVAFALQACKPVAVEAAASSAIGNVIYVDDSAVAGANDGSSWADAFTDLQDALKIAQAGDAIRIGQGTYKPAPPGGDRAISFNLVSGVIVQGGYAGFGAADPDALDHEQFQTILSGDLGSDDGTTSDTLDDNSAHVVIAENLAPTTTARGLIIERGYAHFMTNECPNEPPFQSQGGGLWCSNADFVMEDCVVRNNIASCQGGGMWLSGGSPQFIRCAFIENRSGTSNEFNYGAGAYCVASARFLDCQFILNVSSHGAGAAWVEGATFRGCRFEHNRAGEIAGALTGGDFMLVDCTFDDNTSNTFIGGVTGANLIIVNCSFTRHYAICGPIVGAALRADGNSLVANSRFVGNAAPAIAVRGPANTIINSTIIGNRDCDGGINLSAGDLTLSNSIVWDNSESTPATDANQIVIGIAGSLDIDRSCVQGWTGSLGGIGNHGNDPNFIDADGPDDIYGTADDNPRLRANSPCIDSGDSATLPPDQFDLDDDGDTAEPLPIDLDGLPRIVGASVDAGAYEFQGVPCLEDVTGDGAVNVGDLLAVIVAWGPCISGASCPADLNLNGAVDVTDLLAIIARWGACP